MKQLRRRPIPPELSAKIDEIKLWMFDGDQDEVARRAKVWKSKVSEVLNKKVAPNKKILEAAIEVMNENKMKSNCHPMPHIEPRVVPDDHYSFNLKELNTLVTAIERLVNLKEVMHTKEAAAFLGVSQSQLYRTPRIPSHKVSGIGRLYLRSELIEYIKKF